MERTLQILGLVLCVHSIGLCEPECTEQGRMTDLVKQELGSEVADLVISEYINSAWLPEGNRIFVFEDYKLNTFATVRVSAGGLLDLLNNEQSLTNLLKTKYNQFPTSFDDRMSFIEKIIELHVDYFGRIGSERFFRSLECIAPIESWIKFKSEQDIENFKNYCKNPLFQLCDTRGAWEASFYVIAQDGSAKKCIIKGVVKPMKIASIAILECESEGTYLFYKDGKARK